MHAEHGIFKLVLIRIHSYVDGAAQVCFLQVGLFEMGHAQVAVAEYRSFEIGPGKVGFCQGAGGKIGLWQFGFVEGAMVHNTLFECKSHPYRTAGFEMEAQQFAGFELYFMQHRLHQCRHTQVAGDKGAIDKLITVQYGIAKLTGAEGTTLILALGHIAPVKCFLFVNLIAEIIHCLILVYFYHVLQFVQFHQRLYWCEGIDIGLEEQFLDPVQIG